MTERKRPRLTLCRKYPDELDPPVETVAKCEKCGHVLGSQDPGSICGMCKYVRSTLIGRR